jgi:hypothetical protein
MIVKVKVQTGDDVMDLKLRIHDDMGINQVAFSGWDDLTLWKVSFDYVSLNAAAHYFA